MARDGSNIYSPPAGTTATSGTTIESAKYNAWVADVTADLNLARPIVAGGTGATTGAGILAATGVTASVAEVNILDGATVTTAELNILDGVTATASELNILDGATLTVAELNYVDGVTSAIQTQLNAKVAVIADPGADRIRFWDDSAGAEAYLAVGTGLTITDTTITASAGRILLASKTASASSTLDFTEFDNATYRYYEFVFENVKPTTDDQALNMRFSTDGGSSYDAGASDYQWTGEGRQNGGSVANSGTTTFCQLASTNFMGNAAAEFGLTGKITLYHAGNASARTRYEGGISYDTTAGQLVTAQIGGLRNATQDTDAVRFLMSAGTIASGVIRMYGVAE